MATGLYFYFYLSFLLSPIPLSSVLVILPISNYRSLLLLGVSCTLHKTENMYDCMKFVNLQSSGRTISNCQSLNVFCILYEIRNCVCNYVCLYRLVRIIVYIILNCQLFLLDICCILIATNFIFFMYVILCYIVIFM